MDSLTQFALGAAVSTIFLGKTLGPRKAALLGGVLGTLPDLDVFLPADDPVDDFVFHRGWTHSVFVHLLAAPFIGELLMRSMRLLRDHRFLVWMAVFLCLSTHAIIDAMTVYGTRILWPIHVDPVGIGSIFIIDLAYTLPLLGVVIWAFKSQYWSNRLRNGVVTALIVSSAYLALAVLWQANVTNRASVIFARAGIEAKSIFAIASPINLVWRVISLENDRYHNLYLSPFDDDLQAMIYSHPRHPELVACLRGNDAFEKLKWFSRGYYRSDLEGNQIVVSDLRMGLTPHYIFKFAIAEYDNGIAQAISPKPSGGQMNVSGQDLDWLTTRLQGKPAIRATETPKTALNATKRHASC